jgi:hypothetical protein
MEGLFTRRRSLDLHTFWSMLPIALCVCLPSPAAAVIEDIVDIYQGQWNNTTFPSSGSASLDIQINGSVVTADVEMGGGVFGLFDPNGDGATLTGSIVNGNAVFNDTVMIYGDVSGTVMGADGSVDLTLAMIPGFMEVNATGTIAAGIVDLDYEVVFIDFDPTLSASGTLDAMAAPEASAWLSGVAGLATVLAAARVRRRGAKVPVSRQP